MDNKKIDKNAQANAEKADKKAQKKNANKKPNIFVRMGGKIKAVVSELKKVTWPTFPTVLKRLGAVLVTVLVMLVLILVIDLGLQQLLKLVQGGGSKAAALISKIGEVL